MGRRVAVIWHASFSIVAAGLYFFFVLPRWWELIGATPHALGMVLRIVTGVVIGLAALPVVFTLLRTRKPEYGAPQLALTLRFWSIVAHVLAGVLVVGTAISEIWFSLDRFGQWLFGVYGGAAAIALLGIVAFYLSFIAELPPKPPKPPKAKKQRRRFRRKGKGAEEGSDERSDEDAEAGAEEGTEAGSEESSEAPSEADEDETAAETAAADESEGDESAGDESAADESTADKTEGVETAGVETEAEAEAESDKADAELVSAGGRHKLRPSGKRRTKNSD